MKTEQVMTPERMNKVFEDLGELFYRHEFSSSQAVSALEVYKQVLIKTAFREG